MKHWHTFLRWLGAAGAITVFSVFVALMVAVLLLGSEFPFTEDKVRTFVLLLTPIGGAFMALYGIERSQRSHSERHELEAARHQKQMQLIYMDARTRLLEFPSYVRAMLLNRIEPHAVALGKCLTELVPVIYQVWSQRPPSGDLESAYTEQFEHSAELQNLRAALIECGMPATQVAQAFDEYRADYFMQAQGTITSMVDGSASLCTTAVREFACVKAASELWDQFRYRAVELASGLGAEEETQVLAAVERDIKAINWQFADEITQTLTVQLHRQANDALDSMKKSNAA